MHYCTPIVLFGSHLPLRGSQTVTDGESMDAHSQNTLGSPRMKLLSVDDTGRLLNRSAEAIRSCIKRDTEFSRALRGARVKLGRNIYFRQDLVEQIIIDSTGA